MRNSPPLSQGKMPEKDPRLHWVECLKANTEVVFKIYSPLLHRRDVHFVLNQGTFPCYPDHSKCEPMHDEKTLRFFGYLFGWHAGRMENAFVQLPLEACRQLLSQFTDGQDLRGNVIRVSRGKTKNARVTVKRDQYAKFDGVPLFADIDPDESLHRLWERRRQRNRFIPGLFSGDQDFGEPPQDAESA